LQRISDAVKEHNADAVRQYREELEPAATGSSVWEHEQTAAALWNAYDISGMWSPSARNVSDQEVVDTLEIAIHLINKNASDNQDNVLPVSRQGSPEGRA
jgi:hypothetical protein